ncbi:MAG: 30S ribosomal protein S15 [Thermoproteota archaeon]|nr:30S ribosomal protein S15 [Candidatus Brockarchaeota archaeon]MBO3767847.1 30S ribosomal protein S15 [Candidatus Brockarchaeota archaeon]
MARMYSHKKGKSGSIKPIVKTKQEWVQMPPEEIKKLVVNLYKEGSTKSLIGAILRDNYGIPSVKLATGMSITEILKEAGEDPSYGEDLKLLTLKAERLRKHLERYKSDKLNVHNLQLIESKIRRLSKYYKRIGVLPKDWKYEPKFEWK